LEKRALVAAICPAACRFALLDDADPRQPVLSHYLEFRTSELDGALAAFHAYRHALGRDLPRRLGLSVSAPVGGHTFTVTQSGWRISLAELRDAFGFEQVVAVNDAASVGLALGVTDLRDARPLGGSRLPMAPLPAGRYALINLDFGLGVSAVDILGDEPRVLDTEAGHLTFAPETEVETRLADGLRARHGRVSYERLLSWQGLSNMHALLGPGGGAPAEPLSPLEIVLQGRPGGDPLCARTLECYAGVLGAFAGDVALAMGIDGGVFLTGRFVFEAHEHADWDAFRTRFEAKGRLAAFVQALPTWALTNPGSVLTGVARRLSQAGPAKPARRRAAPKPAEPTPEALAADVLEGAATGLLVLDADLRILASNARFWEGSSAPQALRRPGRPVASAFRAMARGGDWSPKAAALALRDLAARTPYTLERAALGGVILRDDARPVSGGRWIVTSQDITRSARRARELESLAGELREARNAAEAANHSKSAFLATMSHEIRTPLNGVLGMVQAIAFDELAPVQRERLDIIRESGESLLAILNDILDLSKIEAGQLELEEVDFDLRSLMQGAHAAFTAIANKKGVSFSLRLAQGADGAYRGDPTRLRQILYNVVSNALKFTEAGEVRVAAAYEDGQLSLTVADTGIGIDPARLPALFDRFIQADASTTRRYGGTGLGLSICRELAEMMGGTIGAQSEPGRGATVTFRAPIVRVCAGTAGSAAGAHLRPAASAAPEPLHLRVLAAEDNPVNRLVLRTLLHQLGVDPHIVEDGEQAVAAWRDGAWDIVLMDIQMPGLDGVDATRAIRALEAELGRPRTPIVALTANAMAHQISEYLEAGMDTHVAKPIQVQALFHAIVSQTEPAAEPPLREVAG
jgi:signal transduction histidine kinase/glucokinase/ActR/RegA family two-component response regulator